MKAATLFLLASLTAASLSAGPALPFDTPPSAVKTVQAEKPATVPAGSGYVALLVTVKTDGTVADAKVLKSTNPELETVAREAMLQWKFNPAQKNGKPIEVSISLMMRFT